jgi:hypothetical protein
MSLAWVDPAKWSVWSAWHCTHSLLPAKVAPGVPVPGATTIRSVATQEIRSSDQITHPPKRTLLESQRCGIFIA